MWIALQRAGEQVGRGRVARLMREAGIQGAKRRERPPAHDNARSSGPPPPRPGAARLQRRGPRPALDRDLTYLRSWEGASFFAFVIAAFSRRVVGWQLASHMRTDLGLDALRMDTDRGSQYTSADYTQELNDHAHSSSSPSSNTFPGSTTRGCTNPSETSLRSSSRTYTLPGGLTELSLSEDWKPTNKVSVEPGPAQNAPVCCADVKPSRVGTRAT